VAQIQVTKLFDEHEITIRVEQLARMVVERLPDNYLLVGSFVFVADFIRALHRIGCNPSVEFIRLSSYGLGRQSSGNPRLIGETELDLAGRTVLLVDDIVDTGRTLLYAHELLREKRVAKILTCALVDKPSRREVVIALNFVGFTVPDVFIVGYGVDYAHQYR
jgi:hypoxanthine phosphoribosyltransferase